MMCACLSWRATRGAGPRTGTRSDRRVLPLLQAQVARPLVITEGILFPSILAPRDGVHDGVSDGNVQAIFSRRLIAGSGAPGRRPRLPQLAGTDPAVNVMRQQRVQMVHKEKNGTQYEQRYRQLPHARLPFDVAPN